FLACSAYKFFGPHQGIVWGKLDHLQRVRPYKVRPASDASPDRWETGTQAHELQAGVLATLNYLAELGQPHADAYRDAFPGMAGRRLALHAAMAEIQAYEQALVTRLIAGLREIPGVTLHGLLDPADVVRRVPTVALTVVGHSPRALAEGLGQRGVFVWDGNYYALNLMERLGLEEHGGALRIGLAHYNTAEEVDRIIAALREVVTA
ncbi:MAG TPA: aminotransferase class V-fold PLP-dependent enzyme, partial [Ktedonobacterales bacterium]